MRFTVAFLLTPAFIVKDKPKDETPRPFGSVSWTDATLHRQSVCLSSIPAETEFTSLIALYGAEEIKELLFFPFFESSNGVVEGRDAETEVMSAGLLGKTKTRRKHSTVVSLWRDS